MGAIRLFLALVVVGAHFQGAWLYPQLKVAIPAGVWLGVHGGLAVLLFYVISGFLISVVLAEKYAADSAGTLGFYRARFIRIFALYWPVVAGGFILMPSIAAAFAAQAGPLQWFTALFLFGMDWHVAFIGWNGTIVFLSQAWTLGAELTFYALAPFILRSARAVLALMAASFALRLAIDFVFGFSQDWSFQFFPSTLGFFLLGNVAWRAGRRWPGLLNPRLGLALLALAAGTLLYDPYYRWDGRQFWIAILCFAVALPSVFAATRKNRLLNALGDLSYPIYLIHIVALGVMLPGDSVARYAAIVGSDLVVAGALCGVVVMAAGVHWLIERPVSHLMRAILASGGAARRTAAGVGKVPAEFPP